ncbi:MAG TPA: hypothetical protein VFH73_16100 [Polyangia bacterium]|nr:hypothetical protein [Polyangia bacterium]
MRLVLLLFVVGLAGNPIVESDIFFRLKIGQEILAEGAIPATNLLSFTHPDHPDLDLAWLFEVVMAGVFRVGGFAAVVLTKTAVLVATFAVAFWVSRRRGAGAVASALALAVSALVMRERLVERPHIFSFLGEVALLAFLEAFDRRAPAPLRAGVLGRAATLFVLCALWANLHAGAFVAVIMLALFALGTAIDERRASAAAPAAVLTGVALLALMATPAGWGIFRYLWLHLQLPRLHAVDEFRAPTWTSDAGLVVFGLAVVCTLVTLGILTGPRRRLPARQSLPVIGLGLLACHSVRFGADFALLAAPVLAVGLSLVFARLRRIPAAAAVAPAGPVAVGLALLAVTIVPRAGAVMRGEPFVRLGVDDSAIPLDAIAFVERHGLRQRMYNDFEIGSYLAFQGYPRYRVFVDPRLPAYPEDFHRLLGRDDLPREAWDAAMSRYQVDSALLAYAGLNRRVAWWDPATWALVYRQHDARVFVRRLPRWRDFIAAYEIPATFAFTVESGATTVPLSKPPATSPVAACVWQQRQGDLLFDLISLDRGNEGRAEIAYRRALAAPSGCLASADEARLGAWLGAVDLRAGRWQDALALLDRALAHNQAGDDLSTLTNRAIALEALGQSAAASLAWGTVAAAAGASDTALAKKALHRQAETANLSSRSETRPTRR